MITRDQYNCYGAAASIILAAVSLGAALNKHSHVGSLDHESWGKLIVAFWAVAPPVFFWVDWVYFCKDMAPEAPERDIAKHTHDLARNIWVGLVAVLTFAFFKIST